MLIFWVDLDPPHMKIIFSVILDDYSSVMHLFLKEEFKRAVNK